MKIGVSAFAWTTEFGEEDSGILANLREHGLEGFEIPMFDPAALDAAGIRRAFKASRIECTVCAILPQGINPISPDAGARKKAHSHLVQCVETCAELGAHLLGGPVYAPIGFLPGRRRTQDEWKWAIEEFQALGDALDAHGVDIAIEPVNRSETFFLNTASEAASFCDAVAHPRVGAMIDTFHANIEEKSIPAAVKTLGNRLKHLHISENDRSLLGSGHVEFPAILSALRQIDYDGYLMIEGFAYSTDPRNKLGALWADVNVSPEDIAFQGAAYLQNLMRQTN